MGMTREEAYKMAIKACESVWNDKTCKQIKSALSEQRTGNWVSVSYGDYCSECDHYYPSASYSGYEFHYCPNCGARMESEDKE